MIRNDVAKHPTAAAVAVCNLPSHASSMLHLASDVTGPGMHPTVEAAATYGCMAQWLHVYVRASPSLVITRCRRTVQYYCRRDDATALLPNNGERPVGTTAWLTYSVIWFNFPIRVSGTWRTLPGDPAKNPRSTTLEKKKRTGSPAECGRWDTSQIPRKDKSQLTGNTYVLYSVPHEYFSRSIHMSATMRTRYKDRG